MPATIRYVLLCAIRDRLFAGIFIAVLAATLLAYAVGSTAFAEESQMAVVLGAGAIRLVLAIGLMTFACFYMHRAFENREMETLLSKPLSRSAIAISLAAGFFLLALLLSIPAASLLIVLHPIPLQGLLLWGTSLFLELCIAAGFALFASFVLTSAVASVLGAFGMYLLSRIMVYFTMTADGRALAPFEKFLAEILTAIAHLIPRLDRFARSEWLIYADISSADWLLTATQSAIFLPLLLAAAMIDFNRRQF